MFDLSRPNNFQRIRDCFRRLAAAVGKLTEIIMAHLHPFSRNKDSAPSELGGLHAVTMFLCTEGQIRGHHYIKDLMLGIKANGEWGKNSESYGVKVGF